MVSANKPAAMKLTANPIRNTAATPNTTPKDSASSGATRPVGTGRLRVRSITLSMSRSYHMLIAPEAPAAMAMHRTATAARSGCKWPGAAIKPASPVNTTSDMTRGFINAM